MVTFRLIDFIRYIKVNEKNHEQRKKMVDIFKQFQDLHQFKLETFQTTLDDNLSLNDNYSEFTSVVLIPYFNIKKHANILTYKINKTKSNHIKILLLIIYFKCLLLLAMFLNIR